MADCVPIDTSNIVEVADFAQTIKADLTVVGPELPMVLGIGDEFVRRGLAIFCPSRAAAEIEGSKAFAREFMTRHKIPSPRYEVCATTRKPIAFVRPRPLRLPVRGQGGRPRLGQGQRRGDRTPPKPRTVVDEMMADKKFGSAGAKLVMEEFLDGEEVSFLVFSDGARVVPMVSVQDHKRALDGDEGPNTGGMGTVSPATNLSLDVHKQIMQEIILPTIAGLAAEGRRYQGVLFAGPDDHREGAEGPRVQRALRRPRDPGDHGAHALRRRADPAAGARTGTSRRRRSTGPRSRRCAWCSRAAATRTSPRSDKVVNGPRRSDGRERRGRLPRRHRAKDGKVTTVGGRVLGVTALGANLDVGDRARLRGGRASISFDGMHYRKDIGAAGARPAARPALGEPLRPPARPQGGTTW